MNPVKTVTMRSKEVACATVVTMSPSYLMVPGSSFWSGKGVLVNTRYPLLRNLRESASIASYPFLLSSSGLMAMEFPYGLSSTVRGMTGAALFLALPTSGIVPMALSPGSLRRLASPTVKWVSRLPWKVVPG